MHPVFLTEQPAAELATKVILFAVLLGHFEVVLLQLQGFLIYSQQFQIEPKYVKNDTTMAPSILEVSQESGIAKPKGSAKEQMALYELKYKRKKLVLFTGLQVVKS